MIYLIVYSLFGACAATKFSCQELIELHTLEILIYNQILLRVTKK